MPKQHDVSPYLQVDLGQVTTVQQVATQGNPSSAARNERHKRWVTKFSLEFSQDGNDWTECQESGELKVRKKIEHIFPCFVGPTMLHNVCDVIMNPYAHQKS